MGVGEGRSLQVSLVGTSVRAFVAESAFVDFYAHAFVCISERHSRKGAAVHLLYGEKVVIDCAGFEDMLVHNDVLKHVFCHEKTLVHQFQTWEQDVLQELEITVIAVRHIAA